MLKLKWQPGLVVGKVEIKRGKRNKRDDFEWRTTLESTKKKATLKLFSINISRNRHMKTCFLCLLPNPNPTKAATEKGTYLSYGEASPFSF
jgi:hypothetical protein